MWKLPSSLVKKKFKVLPSAELVVASVLICERCDSLWFFHHEIINVAQYCDRFSIQWKRPMLLSEGVTLLSNNAEPYTVRLTKDQIDGRNWITWPKAPIKTFTCSLYWKPYSWDLTYKTMMRRSRLCSNSLNNKAPNFKRVVSLNWSHTTNVYVGCNYAKNSGRYLVHDIMVYFLEEEKNDKI